MKCKYCDAEMAEWGGFCPVCGKSNAQEAEASQMTADEEKVLRDTVTDEEEYEPSPKLKRAKRTAMMAGCIALLAVLATVLFFGIRSDGDVSKWFDWMKPKANDIYRKDSYTVEDKKALKKGDVVVATMNGMELTNTQLQFYYWSTVYDFLGNNYYYLSYMGFDYNKPLDQQACYFDKSMTWQQYFLQTALDTWQSNMAFIAMAKENNFQLPAKEQQELADIPTTLEAKAKEGGYANADALVQDSFGPGATVEGYVEYMEDTYISYLYFAQLYEAAEPTMEELEAYYAENREKLESSGIKQDGSVTVDVRHILVHIDNIVAEMDKEKDGEEDKTESKYTEEHWQACLEAAQKIYDEFLAGDQSEKLFGELANKYSDDQGGKVTDGGIYTGVKKGQMVAEFDAWCFDESRKPGDTGMVKTKFGYHVMYFVGSEQVWITQTRSQYMSEKSNEIVADALARFAIEVKFNKIVLGNVTL